VDQPRKPLLAETEDLIEQALCRTRWTALRRTIVSVSANSSMRSSGKSIAIKGFRRHFGFDGSKRDCHELENL
jgi:hypothetical protein